MIDISDLNGKKSPHSHYSLRKGHQETWNRGAGEMSYVVDSGTDGVKLICCCASCGALLKSSQAKAPARRPSYWHGNAVNELITRIEVEKPMHFRLGRLLLR